MKSLVAIPTFRPLHSFHVWSPLPGRADGHDHDYFWVTKSCLYIFSTQKITPKSIGVKYAWRVTPNPKMCLNLIIELVSISWPGYCKALAIFNIFFTYALYVWCFLFKCWQSNVRIGQDFETWPVLTHFWQFFVRNFRPKISQKNRSWHDFDCKMSGF